MTYEFLVTKYRDGQVVGTGYYAEIIRFVPSLSKVLILKPFEDTSGYFKARTAEDLAAEFPTGLKYFPANEYGLVVTDAEADVLFPFESTSGVGGEEEWELGYVTTGAGMELVLGVATQNYLNKLDNGRRALATAALVQSRKVSPRVNTRNVNTGQAIGNAFKSIFNF